MEVTNLVQVSQTVNHLNADLHRGLDAEAFSLRAAQHQFQTRAIFVHYYVLQALFRDAMRD